MTARGFSFYFIMPFLSKLFSGKASFGPRDWERLPQRRSPVSCSSGGGWLCSGRPPDASLEGPRPGLQDGALWPSWGSLKLLRRCRYVQMRFACGSLMRGFSGGSACLPQVGQEGSGPVREAWPPAHWPCGLGPPGPEGLWHVAPTRGRYRRHGGSSSRFALIHSLSGQSSRRTEPLAGPGVMGAMSLPRPHLSTSQAEPAGWTRAGQKPGLLGPAPRPAGACGRMGALTAKQLSAQERPSPHTLRSPVSRTQELALTARQGCSVSPLLTAPRPPPRPGQV